MNEYLESFIAGLIQGITELLPVSSSGHLLLFSNLTGNELKIAEIAVIHIGTLISIMIAFYKDILKCFNLKIAIKVLISAIPAGIIGLVIEELLNINTNIPILIVLSLIVWGIILIVIDKKTATMKFRTTELKDVSLKQAIIIGLGQVLALIPGTSRSGVTTIFGIISGLDPKLALSYSFLTGIPLLAASGFYGTYKMVTSDTGTSNTTIIFIATATALITGIFAAFILKQYINKKIFTICGWYRIAIGIILALVLIF
ncbi:undecaprenyl-diphosphate phosphatase [Candidatus Dojkabacteria bacterium]|nr:undecaprenyl-diphosphate phosphatase [Candidatus Dojkabacteria bacterium]